MVFIAIIYRFWYIATANFVSPSVTQILVCHYPLTRLKVSRAVQTKRKIPFKCYLGHEIAIYDIYFFIPREAACRAQKWNCIEGCTAIRTNRWTRCQLCLVDSNEYMYLLTATSYDSMRAIIPLRRSFSCRVVKWAFTLHTKCSTEWIWGNASEYDFGQ